jgi:hypothetical protein
VEIDGGMVRVRASRLGIAEGRLYSISAEAADLAGNTASEISICLVPHDQSQK